MLDNPVQFAVVREDPGLEDAVIRRTGAQKVLLIASGGCSALSLQVLHPELELTLIDANPAQIELVQRKVLALRSLSGRERELAFNVESADPRALNARGNFESLFRQLRLFWEEFVFQEGRIREAFERRDVGRLLDEARANKYWPVSFELFFSDAVLNAMFGAEATQYAAPGSYPRYFQAAFEAGMARREAAQNRFLQHVFLGMYLRDPAGLPPYLKLAPSGGFRFEYVAAKVDEVLDFGRFDVISLSNLFDWTEESSIQRIARRVSSEMKPGAAVVFRQLNNRADFQSCFGQDIEFDEEWAESLHASDTSLFYSRFNIGVRKG